MEWLTGAAARRQFECFVADATDDLFRTAYLMTWDLRESEDLVQETFLRVARRWNRVRSMEYPLAYGRRILTNLALDGAKRRSRLRQELEEAGRVDAELVDPFATQALRWIDNAAELRWALSTLPRRQRAVLVLRYWEELPEAEVAQILGCSVGTVKSTASRGVARLRQALDGATATASPETTSECREGKT